MVVKSCFVDMEGRMGLKREWEFVPKVGEKKSNERVCFMHLIEILCWHYLQDVTTPRCPLQRGGELLPAP